jgi:hypothetical protein
LALDYVLGNLETLGWVWKICDRYQIGYDIEATKGEKNIRIEVKGRSIGDYSGTRNESLIQKNTPRRRFHFSKPQLESGDFFIAVFVGPLTRRGVVMSHRDLLQLKDGGDALIVTFRLDSKLNFVKTKRWRDGRELDITQYIEGWNRIEIS